MCAMWHTRRCMFGMWYVVWQGYYLWAASSACGTKKSVLVKVVVVRPH